MKIMKKIILWLVSIILCLMLFVIFYFQVDINPWSEQIITVDELLAEEKRLEKINSRPENEKINSKDYPIVLGTFSENRLVLSEVYHCSDMCPYYGSVLIIYQNIKNKELCSLLGGRTRLDAFGGSFIGCSPKI